MRDKTVDQAKGIGILLVLLGHSITLMDNTLNTIILSFHMPLFFFLSGMVMKKDTTLWIYTKKRIKVIFPSIVTGFILNVVTSFVCDVCWLKSETLASVNWLSKLDNWFLITLLISSLTAFALIKLGDIYCLIGSCLSLFVFVLYSSNNTIGLKYIEESLIAVPFVVGGYLNKRYIVAFYNAHKRGLISEILTIFIGIVGIILAWQNGACAMAANIYNNKLLFFATSWVGIYIVYRSSELFDSKLLLFCGQNSLIIFVTHFCTQKIINTVLRSAGFYSYTQYPFYLVVFICLLVVELPLTYFVRKYLPFLFGMEVERKSV